MPGETQPCTCSGDQEGAQVCDDDGQWVACECADEQSPCEACLASGGTWQPEASACTQNCDLMDISCYTTSCPETCSADSCGTCFGQEACEEAGCQWHAEGPAMWCTSPW